MSDLRHSVELFIGGYDANPGGVRTLVYSPEQGWRLSEPDSSIRHASYAAFSLRHDLHFFVEEREDGRIGAYKRLGNDWIRVQDIPSEGAGPCFIALNDDESALAVANYESGTIAWFDLDATGLMSRPKLVTGNFGRGPDRKRQDRPHAHCVRFHNQHLYSVDLGTDEILMHLANGDPKTCIAFRMPAGQGPRHMLVHPSKPLAYVLTELGSCLFTLAIRDDGALEELHRVSTLRHGFEGHSIAAHLSMNSAGTGLYASNRGEDTLVQFEIGSDGAPVFVSRTPTGSEGPRHFLLLEEAGLIIIAHQSGGVITVLSLASDGRPGDLLWSAPLSQAAFVGEMRPG